MNICYFSRLDPSLLVGESSQGREAMNIGKFVPVVAGVVLAFAMHSAAFAAETKIQSTVINTGDPHAILPPRFFSTIDAETVNCTNTKGCVLVMNVVSQIIGGGAGGKWSITVAVDGAYVDGHSRSSQGYEPNGGISAVGNWQNFYRVAAGAHTVTVQVYVGTAAIERRWSVAIGVGK
jgi:hypothetical protein